jgi:hypothetical protein
MKKLINIITVLTIGLFFSCSSDNDAISNNNGIDYEFTITINGQVHKVKGNSKDGIPFSLYNNACWAQFASGLGAMVELDIHDVTKSNYISGQNLGITIILPNPLLGTNQATLSFTGDYFDTLATSLGSNYFGFMSVSSTLVTVNGASSNAKIPIIITDLGTPTTTKTPYDFLSPYNFGQTIKGNYSGTIYLSRIVAGQGIFYDIPVKLSIDFKAIRMN